MGAAILDRAFPSCTVQNKAIRGLFKFGNQYQNNRKDFRHYSNIAQPQCLSAFWHPVGLV